MSIQDESIVLDTDIGIFGLRRVPDSTACAEIVENLNRFRFFQTLSWRALRPFDRVYPELSRMGSGHALRESN